MIGDGGRRGLREFAQAYKAKVQSRGNDNFWLARVLVLLFFAYLLVRYFQNPAYRSIFSGINLGIHEFGHLIFGPFGQWLGIAGGTIFQLFVPLVSIIMFYKQEDYFAISFSFGWLSTNLFEVAGYVADARAMALPLVSPFGGGVYHDWNYLLDHVGLLACDTTIGVTLRYLAYLFMLGCLVYGAWILFIMKDSEKIEGRKACDRC